MALCLSMHVPVTCKTATNAMPLAASVMLFSKVFYCVCRTATVGFVAVSLSWRHGEGRIQPHAGHLSVRPLNRILAHPLTHSLTHSPSHHSPHPHAYTRRLPPPRHSSRPDHARGTCAFPKHSSRSISRMHATQGTQYATNWQQGFISLLHMPTWGTGREGITSALGRRAEGSWTCRQTAQDRKRER